MNNIHYVYNKARQIWKVQYPEWKSIKWQMKKAKKTIHDDHCWCYGPVPKFRWWYMFYPWKYVKATEAFMTKQHAHIMKQIDDIDQMHQWIGMHSARWISLLKSLQEDADKLYHAWSEDTGPGPRWPWDKETQENSNCD